MSCKDCSGEDDVPCCANGCCCSDGEFGMCICCGAEMFEERGCWFHHTQKDIPFDERMLHYSLK